MGLSGNNFEEGRRFVTSFFSGEIASPIVSGLILLRENMLGLVVSIRGGTGGATLAAIPLDVPPGPVRFFTISVGPLNPLL